MKNACCCPRAGFAADAPHDRLTIRGVRIAVGVKRVESAVIDRSAVLLLASSTASVTPSEIHLMRLRVKVYTVRLQLLSRGIDDGASKLAVS